MASGNRLKAIFNLMAATATCVALAAGTQAMAAAPDMTTAPAADADPQGPVNCPRYTTAAHCGPNLTLVRFARVDQGIYRGSAPRTDDDVRFLKALHVKTILSLELLPFHAVREERLAASAGINYLNIPIQGSPVEPSITSVDAAVTLLGEKTLWPVYVHCLLGRDRTSLVVALYKVYDDHWSPDVARQTEMIDFGLTPTKWQVSGLYRFFGDHAYGPN